VGLGAPLTIAVLIGRYVRRRLPWGPTDRRLSWSIPSRGSAVVVADTSRVRSAWSALDRERDAQVSGAGRRRAGPSSEFCAAGAPHSADAARSRSGVSRIAGSAGTTTPEFPQLQQCTASPASLPPRLAPRRGCLGHSCCSFAFSPACGPAAGEHLAAHKGFCQCVLAAPFRVLSVLTIQ
jgi:hypothetical protein